MTDLAQPKAEWLAELEAVVMAFTFDDVKTPRYIALAVAPPQLLVCVRESLDAKWSLIPIPVPSILGMLAATMDHGGISSCEVKPKAGIRLL